MDIRKIVQRNRNDAPPAPDSSSLMSSPTVASESLVKLLPESSSPDITDVRHSQNQPDPRAILDSIGECIYDWDIISDRLAWGPNVDKVLDVADSAHFASGRSYSKMIAPESLSSRFSAIHGTNDTDAGGGVPFQTRYGLLPQSGNPGAPTVWVEDTGRWFAGSDGKPGRAHGIVRIITNHYRAERELELRSRFDPQTGCLNRPNLIELTSRMLDHAAVSRKPFCILLINIENLFVLNRTYGYDIADEIIIATAHRLRKTMRAPDSLARYAGAKFALLLETCNSEQMVLAGRRFLNEISQSPFDTSAGAISVNLRMGGVCGPVDGRTANILFQHAEDALDHARSSGVTRFAAYEPSLMCGDSRLKAARLSDDIVSALNDGRIVLALQDVVATQAGRTGFSEALVRLRRPDGTIVLPGAFLPAAEKAGLVPLIDQRVLELAQIRLSREPGLVLSINVSGATLHDPDWPDRLKALLSIDPTVASRLILEITETCVITDVAVTESVIARVHALGVRVAMDDFGAGHTSFRNLRHLGFDLIKMDGAFIQNLSRSADDRFFVRTLIDLAHHLGVPIVAEWVESAEAAQLLTEWGVDYLQGYLYGQANIVEQPRAAAA